MGGIRGPFPAQPKGYGHAHLRYVPVAPNLPSNRLLDARVVRSFVSLTSHIRWRKGWHGEPSFGSAVVLLHISLDKARETRHDGGCEDPAHDDEEHTPPLRRTVRYPAITLVEARDGQQQVEGVQEGLEGWRGRLVGGG